MGIPRGETADGFETQFGVNHLGHFALTGLLLDMMPDSPTSRVVTVSSTASWMGRIQFDDLNSTTKYTRYAAYGQSKLSNLLFARELQRRLTAAGMSIRSMAAHPGFVLTELQPRAAREAGAKMEGMFYDTIAPLLAHSVEEGVLPQLYAGQSPEATGGSFYGPARRHMVGGAKAVAGPRAGGDMAVAKRLWEVSEKLTGVVYPYGLGEK
jgi:NAD(P)-dependent dehydrogenase (short-subunit alcohol dehydrogenase family)